MLCGYSPDYIYYLFRIYAKKVAKINSISLVSKIGNCMVKKNRVSHIKGIKSGKSIENAYNKLAENKGIDKISDISKIPLVIPSVDINTSKEFIFTNNIPKKAKNKSKYITDIKIGKVVRASCCFPAVFCPYVYKNHKFMDGGILDNIPVNEVKKQGVDKIIAVNFRADSITKKSNIMDISMRVIDIMGNKISEDNLEMADYILTIKTDKTGLLDFKKIDDCYRYGYNQTLDNIEKIKNLLK